VARILDLHTDGNRAADDLTKCGDRSGTFETQGESERRADNKFGSDRDPRPTLAAVTDSILIVVWWPNCIFTPHGGDACAILKPIFIQNSDPARH
jgi:hypothetical protein